MIITSLVCIVDDAPTHRLLFRESFSHYCAQCSLAVFTDGISLFEAMAQFDQLPTLILLDRHIPGLNGHQILLRLKAHPVYKKIPVVMMSINVSAEEISQSYEAGVNSFLNKSLPFDSMKEQLRVICQYWLEMNQKPI